MNANNGVSNTNRNNAGSDQEDINLKITLLIRVSERQTNKRQCVYFYVNRLRYVVTLMRYFLCLACIFNINMKKISNISSNITIDDIRTAAMDSFVGHNKKPEVIKFRETFDDSCNLLYEKLMNGTWKELLEYRPFVKINNNNKVRYIESPSLITRIYQHLLLNLLNPIYKSKDNFNGLNCKIGCGITANIRSRSIVRKLKHIYYDRTDLKYCLIIDQRKCYDHITEKVFRRIAKKIIDDKWIIDFAIDSCFVNGRLPIGTPTSPFIHHIVMLTFDYFVKEISPFSVRYADDNFLAFYTKEDAQAAKWRIKNFWWYNLNIRSKRNTSVIKSLDEPCDFCGYVFHRNNKKICEHNKGYVKIRECTAIKARKCRSDNSWNSYFGLLKHADSFSLMKKIENTMKLKDLTSKIRINRSMDARNIDIRDLVGVSIDIYDYEIKYNSQNQPNWIKCLIGVREVKDGNYTGKTLAYEFHGNYQGIIQFIKLCESKYGKSDLLPLEDVEIENQCGYIFKGSTNQLIYIENESN